MKIRSLVMVILISFLTACRLVPIQNVDNAPVVNASGHRLSAPQIEKAIRQAAANLGWRVNQAGPGHLVATLMVRKHVAVVDITYSASGYNIRYKSSQNLKAQGSQIHPNYNGWIQRLDQTIQSNLTMM